MKWTLNRINYYKTLYINLHYISTTLSTLGISQSSIKIGYYDNVALYDDRTLVIRITKYEFIFVMLTELRTVLKILFVILCFYKKRGKKLIR